MDDNDDKTNSFSCFYFDFGFTQAQIDHNLNVKQKKALNFSSSSTIWAPMNPNSKEKPKISINFSSSSTIWAPMNPNSKKKTN